MNRVDYETIEPACYRQAACPTAEPEREYHRINDNGVIIYKSYGKRKYPLKEERRTTLNMTIVELCEYFDKVKSRPVRQDGKWNIDL